MCVSPSRVRRRQGRAGRTSGNLAQEAHRRLKAFILTSRVFPGDRLLHRVLVERLGMSSTPVREAMGRLIQEGYVQHIPNRGYFVREMSPEEAEQVFEAREALEPHAAALAAERMQGEDIRRVECAAHAFGQAIGTRPRKARVLLDVQFHLAIARLARSQFLLHALEGLLHQIAAKRNVEGVPAEEGGRRADLAHRRILAALRERNPDAARDAMGAHIRQSKVEIVRQLRHHRPADSARPARPRTATPRRGEEQRPPMSAS